MFSHQLYNVVHIVGIVLVMCALAGAAVHAMTGAAPGPGSPRRLLAVLHGSGAFLVLLGGFGMLARLGVMQGGGAFPGWVWAKLAIWAIVAVALFVPRRRPGLGRPLLLALPLLGGLAAYFAIYKPF